MGAFNDLSGRRFGKLTVIGREGTDRSKKITWRCDCDCGQICVQRGCDLTNNKVKSCGCSGKKLRDLSGQRFGILTVERRGEDDQRNQKVTWICKCDCGNVKTVRSNDLVRGKVTSCGCNANLTGSEAKAFKHGRAGTKVHHIWKEMRRRCSNSDHLNYESYGGRGITVCERWDSFESFLEDMGEPEPGMSLDRIDNNKGYSKENCRWISHVEQCNNRRNNIFLTIDGVTKTLTQWSRESGINYRTILRRLKTKQNPKDAVFLPVRKSKSVQTISTCKSSSPTYRAWVQMRSRCRNPNDPAYPDYGGRGIKVHEAWEDFDTFIKDMGERPEGVSLDRIHNDGDYEPGNCRWVDQRVQIRNRRNTLRVEVDGVSRSIAEWSEISGVHLLVIWARLKRKWDPRKAIFTPKKSMGTPVTTQTEEPGVKRITVNCPVSPINLFAGRPEAVVGNPISTFRSIGED